MSGYCVERVLDSGLDDRLKKTAVALATYAADDGSRIWPSMPELARRSEQNLRTVKRHMKDLRTMEPPILVVTRPATQQHPAHYRLLVDNLPPRPAPEYPEEPLLPIDGEGVRPDVRPDVPPDVRLDVRRDVPPRRTTPDVPPDVRPDLVPGVTLVSPLTIPGVTAVSPLRGDIQSARGDRAVSPDPSLGSVTRTTSAAAPPQRDPDDDYTAVVTAVVTKDILPRRLEDQALMDATRARCVQLGIPCTDEVLQKAIDSALFRYYRALRLTADLPPDPRGIYHDHVKSREPRLPMPIGLKRRRAQGGRR